MRDHPHQETPPPRVSCHHANPSLKIFPVSPSRGLCRLLVGHPPDRDCPVPGGCVSQPARYGETPLTGIGWGVIRAGWSRSQQTFPAVGKIQMDFSPCGGYRHVRLEVRSFCPFGHRPTGLQFGHSRPGRIQRGHMAPSRLPENRQLRVITLESLLTCLRFPECPGHPPQDFQRRGLVRAWRRGRPGCGDVDRLCPGWRVPLLTRLPRGRPGIRGECRCRSW